VKRRPPPQLALPLPPGRRFEIGESQTYVPATKESSRTGAHCVDFNWAIFAEQFPLVERAK
jgi:hypothetical protein